MLREKLILRSSGIAPSPIKSSSKVFLKNFSLPLLKSFIRSVAVAKATLSDDSACSAIHSRMLLTSCGLPFVGKSIVMAVQ